MKTRKVYMIFLLITVCFSGCDLLNSFYEPTPEKIDDTRFYGNFSYYTSLGLYEGKNQEWYEAFNFKGTNKVYHFVKYSFHSNDGWVYSGDYDGDYSDSYLEFEIMLGQYRYRLWDNEYSSWSFWENYEFRDSNTTLILHNYNYDDLVLQK